MCTRSPRAKAGGEQRAREAPVVGRARPPARRSARATRTRARRRAAASRSRRTRRTGASAFCSSSSSDLRVTGSCASAARDRDRGGIDVGEQPRERRRVRLGVRDLRRQRGEHRSRSRASGSRVSSVSKCVAHRDAFGRRGARRDDRVATRACVSFARISACECATSARACVVGQRLGVGRPAPSARARGRAPGRCPAGRSARGSASGSTLNDTLPRLPPLDAEHREHLAADAVALVGAPLDVAPWRRGASRQYLRSESKFMMRQSELSRGDRDRSCAIASRYASQRLRRR